MEDLLNWFKSFWDGFLVIMESLLLTFLDLLKDFVLFVLEMLLSLAVGILNGFANTFDFLDLTQYISALPSEVTNMMGLIGLGQCLSMIIVAITARILLQTIPFVRWGS